jgi:hypothetical protein
MPNAAGADVLHVVKALAYFVAIVARRFVLFRYPWDVGAVITRIAITNTRLRSFAKKETPAIAEYRFSLKLAREASTTNRASNIS